MLQLKFEIIGKSVRGASHARKGIECQDAVKKVELDTGAIILAVADGHGSESCPYSSTGSKSAVNVFCDIMEEYLSKYADNLELLATYLNREGETRVAQAIDTEWKRRIVKQHRRMKRSIPALPDGAHDLRSVYKQYGTTLLGLVVTESFLFAFQIGDGSIGYVDEGGYADVITSDKILGVETHSLSREAAWEKAISAVRRTETDRRFMYMLSSDGFANSYKDEASFRTACEDYFYMINEHGVPAVRANLPAWLTETSEMGCGDDITLIMAYHAEQEASNARAAE